MQQSLSRRQCTAAIKSIAVRHGTTIARSGFVWAWDFAEMMMASKLLARLRPFDIRAKDVEQMIVTYPVDFLPS